MKRALILGVGGQDGSYLADFLLAQGYDVHGLYRPSSARDPLWRLTPEARSRVSLYRGDLLDPTSVRAAVNGSYASGPGPLEVYNLADQDHVGSSHDTPGYSVRTTYGGVQTLLDECLMTEELKGSIRVFQACSGTMYAMYGSWSGTIGLDCPLDPRSPYAVAKAAAYLLCRHYRRDKGVYVACGVFSQHSSPRQAPGYLLPTIARQAVRVARGEQDRIELTGPDRMVDVGHAREFVEAAWRTLQEPEPGDYPVCTGARFRISSLCRAALSRVGVPEEWFDLADRTEDQGGLFLDAGPAYRSLGWSASVYAEDVLAEVVDHYLRHAEDAR